MSVTYDEIGYRILIIIIADLFSIWYYVVVYLIIILLSLLLIYHLFTKMVVTCEINIQNGGLWI